MLNHSVVFDGDDPHCPLCGSENIEERETAMWESVWNCNDCQRWCRQSLYKGDAAISHSV